MVRDHEKSDNPRREDAMDVEMTGQGLPSMPEQAANWPWSDLSVASSVPVSMDPGQEQGRQSMDYSGNSFLVPGYNFSRLEGPPLQPTAQSSSRSATSSTLSSNQNPNTAPTSSRPPAATGITASTAAIPQYSTPAPKVAIPRANISDHASHRRRRSTRACEPCRQRKVKCDGIRPVCRLCAENHITCQYLDVKRVREQKQLSALTKKVERYEDLLRELEPESDVELARKIRRALDMDEPEPGEPDSDSNSSRGSLDAIDLVEEDLNRNERTRATGFFGKNSEVAWMQKLESESKHRSGRTLEEVMQSQQLRAMGRDRASPFVPLTMVSYHLDDLDIPQLEDVDKYAVPPRRLADRFFNAYMESFHPSFSAVRRKTFTAQYERFIREPEFLRPPKKWLAVLNMVFAIGCRYCDLAGENTGDEDGMVFLARARRLSLAGDMLFQHSDLQQVQVEFLLGFYLLSLGQVNRASKFCNMAFRSALSLGINLRFVDDRTDSAAKEARSRLWWSIFSLEHYIACLTGRVSFATERLSSLPLPIPYEEEDFGKPDVVHLFEDLKLRRRYLKPTLYQTDLEAHAHGEWLNERDPCPSLFFNCVIDLVYIVQAVINKVYSIEGVRERSRQIEKRIRKYAIKMDNWLAKVPSAYQFTSVGGDFRPTDDKFAREKFKLAIHYYSSKITLYRPCLSHTDTHFNTTSQTSARSESLSESTLKGNSGSHSGSGDVGEKEGEKEGEKGTGRGVKDNRRTRFRTEMSLSCLRASCALISLVPDEPDLIYLSTISPWWEHLHCLTQATTALLLGLSNWPTSLPAEEKRSSSATATEPNMPFGPRGHATVLGSSAPGSSIHGEEGGEEFNANPNTAVPPLDVATVVANTKKALRWIFHIAVAGHDTAACRAFVLCVGFMKQIAPTVGIDVSDLPEVEALASIRDEKEHTTPSVQGGVSVGVGAAHAGTGADVHEAPGPGPGEGGAGGMQSESEGEDEGMGTGMRMNEHEMENAQDMVDDTWSGSGTGSEEWGYWGGE